MNKSIFVNGAAGSIGSLGVTQLAHAGFTVFAGVPTQSDIELLRGTHANIRPVLMDVTQLESIDAAVRDVREALDGQPLFGLWNNAGIIDVMAFANLSRERIQQTINTNLTGALLFLHTALPLLERNTSRIVITGSATGIFSSPASSVYTATKSALEGFVDAFRIEMSRPGIQVSLIEPGLVGGNMPNSVAPNNVQVIPQLSEQDRKDYAPLMRAIEKASEKPTSPPAKVADTVVRAFSSNKAKTRYRVGVDAKAVAIIRHFPDGIKDAIQRKIFGI